MPRVTGLFLYPVKSLRGHSVAIAGFDLVLVGSTFVVGGGLGLMKKSA